MQLISKTYWGGAPMNMRRLPDAFDASPAIVGKQLFLRGEKHLYCIGAK